MTEVWQKLKNSLTKRLYPAKYLKEIILSNHEELLKTIGELQKHNGELQKHNGELQKHNRELLKNNTAENNKLALSMIASVLMHPLVKKMCALQPMAVTTKYINPETTGVVLLGKDLESAINYYKFHRSTSKVMPCFVLVDDESFFEETNKDLAGKYDVKTLPFTELLSLHAENLCLYTHKGSVHVENISAFFRLSHKVFQNKIAINYLIDEKSISFCGCHNINYSFYLKKINEINTCYNALADEHSKDIYLRIILTNITREMGYLYLSPHALHEHPEVSALPGDVVCDGGAYDGGTALFFSKRVTATGHVYAFEPVKRTYDALVENLKNYKNVTVEHYGLFSSRGSFDILLNGAGSRLVVQQNENTEKCNVLDIDSYFADKRLSVIKLDIEGAELECLQGAYNTIKRDKPKLMISLYHKPEDIVDIPIWIINNFPEYKLYCSHQSPCRWESMLYAIAPN